jgi:hypothetical protein
MAQVQSSKVRPNPEDGELVEFSGEKVLDMIESGVKQKMGATKEALLSEENKTCIRGVLQASIERDVNDLIYWKFRFRKLGDFCESISQLTTLSATVVAFYAGYDDNSFLSFIAGSLGSVSLALLKASSYSHDEARERTKQLNILLQSSDFHHEIPVITLEEGKKT